MKSRNCYYKFVTRGRKKEFSGEKKLTLITRGEWCMETFITSGLHRRLAKILLVISNELPNSVTLLSVVESNLSIKNT